MTTRHYSFAARALLPLGLSILLGACGRDEAPTLGTPGAIQTGAKAPAGNRSAAEVAATARVGLRCPAPAAQRDAQRPAHDVLGVTPGQTLELARQTVLCSDERLVATSADNRGFMIKTYGQKLRLGFSARPAQAQVQRTGREIVQDMQDAATARGLNSVRPDLQPGEAKWYVSTVGLPGQERVLTVSREEWFAADKLPTLTTVEQALIAKYGAPTGRRTGGNITSLIWSFDAAGQPGSERCEAQPDPEGASRLDSNCGIAVTANLHAPPGNAGLTQKMQVGSVDHARAMAALEATENSLQQADAQRQARELEQASKGAAAPKL